MIPSIHVLVFIIINLLLLCKFVTFFYLVVFGEVEINTLVLRLCLWIQKVFDHKFLAVMHQLSIIYYVYHDSTCQTT